MTVFVALLLTSLTFVFVAYPFFKRRAPLTDLGGDEKQRELDSKRGTAYSMLKELEFDFQSGILTDEDYQDLGARYKGKAISILRDIDNLGKASELGDAIEQQILELRRGKGLPYSAATGKVGKATNVEAEIENEVLRLRRSKGRFCHQCGARFQEGDRFCSHCGTSLDLRRRR